MLNPFFGSVLLGICVAERAERQQAAAARTALEAQMPALDAMRHAYTPRTTRPSNLNCINCGAPHDDTSRCSYCLTVRAS